MGIDKRIADTRRFLLIRTEYGKMAQIGQNVIFQVTAFFDDAAKAGWSEGYYVAAQDYSDAMLTWSSTLVLRMNCCADNFRCLAARISDPTIRGDSVFDNLTNYPVIGTWPTAGVGVGSPYDALLLRLESGALHRGMRLLHGVGLNNFHGTGYAPAFTFNGILQIFATNLKNHYYIKHGKGGKATYLPITSVIPLRRGDHKIGRPFGLLHGRRFVDRL